MTQLLKNIFFYKIKSTTNIGQELEGRKLKIKTMNSKKEL